ncbi:MAG TPA: aminotransferase class IV [Phycisphaerales bacterium]|nr:aminotransferase class IV [Phycisphaerales bacterium]
MIVHLNGELLQRERAAVSAFDRGFLFGDGVYEGLRSFDGWVIAMDLHAARMREGLAEARIDWDASQLDRLTSELLAANDLRNAFIYWQVTRGTPGPDDPVRTRLPARPMRPTVFGYCVPTPGLAQCVEPARVRAATVDDRRWLRGTLKSISLLGNVLAAAEARERGADDAIMVRDGFVAESCTCNVVVVDAHGRMATPSLESAPILAGVTRALLPEIAPGVESRPVRAAELHEAREIILLGTLTMVASVVELDGTPVGTGEPGQAARGILARYTDWIAQRSRANR